MREEGRFDLLSECCGLQGLRLGLTGGVGGQGGAGAAWAGRQGRSMASWLVAMAALRAPAPPAGAVLEQELPEARSESGEEAREEIGEDEAAEILGAMLGLGAGPSEPQPAQPPKKKQRRSGKVRPGAWGGWAAGSGPGMQGPGWGAAGAPGATLPCLCTLS